MCPMFRAGPEHGCSEVVQNCTPTIAEIIQYVFIDFFFGGGSFLVNCKKFKNGKNKFLGLLKNVWLVENTPDSADMLFILSKKLKVLLDKEYQLTSVIK